MCNYAIDFKDNCFLLIFVIQTYVLVGVSMTFSSFCITNTRLFANTLFAPSVIQSVRVNNFVINFIRIETLS